VLYLSQTDQDLPSPPFGLQPPGCFGPLFSSATINWKDWSIWECHKFPWAAPLPYTCGSVLFVRLSTPILGQLTTTDNSTDHGEQPTRTFYPLARRALWRWSHVDCATRPALLVIHFLAPLEKGEGLLWGWRSGRTALLSIASDSECVLDTEYEPSSCGVNWGSWEARYWVGAYARENELQYMCSR